MTTKNSFNWLKEKDQTWFGFLLELALLICLILFLRFYVFQFFRVSGPSMCPTINQFETDCLSGKGEFIFVNEFSYRFIEDPTPGDIIVLKSPNEKPHPILRIIQRFLPFKINVNHRVPYIKRVIGVGGDVIYIEDGVVSVLNQATNDKEILAESYLSDTNQGRTGTQVEKFVVPEDHVAVFGDNRNNSTDSRRCFSSCQNGRSPFIHQKDVIGRAEFVVFPFNRARKFRNELY